MEKVKMAVERSLVQTRAAWLLLAGSALGLEVAALWFQHGMGLDPCVMCIYERVALLGLFAAGLLGALQPRLTLLRWSGYLIWAISAGWGLLLTLEHVGLEVGGPAALNCSFLPEFPAWLPLHEWLPAMFLPTGYCDDVQWQWLSLTMAEWTMVAFVLYLLTLIGVLLLERRSEG